MIAPGAGVRIYLACGVTDMRKGIAGLAAQAQLAEERAAKEEQTGKLREAVQRAVEKIKEANAARDEAAAKAKAAA